MATPSIFEQRIPTLERPSEIVDRVRETVIELGDAELLAFFTSTGGTAGDNIRILLSPDPEMQRDDPIPGFMLWGLALARDVKIGGADFDFGVGWRMYYEHQQRFRQPGEPDAGNLVWKFRRALWANKTLVTVPLPGSDPLADLQSDFLMEDLIGVETEIGCMDLIRGVATYRIEVDRDSI